MTIGGTQRDGRRASRSTSSRRTGTSWCWARRRQATDADVEAAVGAALAAAPAWRDLPFDERAAVFLRAADLLSTTWRDRLNAATMLGQSKTVQQAEIDSACELADFLRFNVHFARQILEQQPVSSPRVWNRIGLPPARGLRPGDHAVQLHRDRREPARRRRRCWATSSSGSRRRPSSWRRTYTMRLFEAAGLPPGVINMVTGDGAAVSEVALPHPALAGIHFTGSTADLPAPVARGRQRRSTATPPTRGWSARPAARTSSSPTPRADPRPLVTGLVRGAFEYQGQKCSAASRAYVPRSLWDGGVRDELAAVDRVAHATATSPTSPTSAARSSTGAPSTGCAGVQHRLRRRPRRHGARGRQRATTASATSSGRPSSRCADPTHEVFRDASTSARCSRVHVYDDRRRGGTTR